MLATVIENKGHTLKVECFRFHSLHLKPTSRSASPVAVAKAIEQMSLRAIKRDRDDHN